VVSSPEEKHLSDHGQKGLASSVEGGALRGGMLREWEDNFDILVLAPRRGGRNALWGSSGRRVQREKDTYRFKDLNPFLLARKDAPWGWLHAAGKGRGIKTPPPKRT